MNRFAAEEIFSGWKRDKKSAAVLILLSLTGIVCIGLTIALSLQTSFQAKKYREIYEDVRYFSILDNFVGEHGWETEGAEATARLQKFLDLLNGSEYFDYYMMYLQPVYIADYSGREENLYGYEYNINLENSTQPITARDGTTRISTDVKGFWVGDRVTDAFQLKLSQGRQFQKEDFTLTDREPISVILGANYAEDYAVGDKIFISFVFAEREADVVGILEEGSNVFYRGKYLNLDPFVIMPVFENNDYNGQAIYNFSVNHLYTLRNSGTIATKLSCKDIQEIIKAYSKEAGFETSYYVEEYSDTETETFGLSLETIQFLLLLLAALLVGLAAILLSFFYCNRIKRNCRYYAILLMNGSSRGQIFRMILAEISIALIVSYLSGALVITLTASMNMPHLLLAFLLLFMGTLFFGAVPAAFSAVVFFRSDLNRHMGEEIF